MISYDFTKLYIQLTTVILPRKCCNASSNSHCLPIMSLNFGYSLLWFDLWGLLTHLVSHSAVQPVLQSVISIIIMVYFLGEGGSNTPSNSRRVPTSSTNVYVQFTMLYPLGCSTTPSNSNCCRTISTKCYTQLTTVYPLAVV